MVDFSLSGAVRKTWDQITQATYSIVRQSDNAAVLEFNTIEETSFKASADLTGYPVEAGIMVTDYKFDNPDTITCRGILERSSNLFEVRTKSQILETLKQLKRGIYLLTVKTRADTYRDFTLIDYEISETADNFGLLEVDMTFQQVVLLKDASRADRNPADSDTVNVGLVSVMAL